MKTIYKYEIPFGDEVAIQMPKDASLIKFGLQGVVGGRPDIFVWAIVDTDAEMEERRFRIHGTGLLLPEDSVLYGSNGDEYEYYDTLFDRMFVWHIFVKP